MDQSQLVLAVLGGDSQDLRVVVEAHGMDGCCEISDSSERLWVPCC